MFRPRDIGSKEALLETLNETPLDFRHASPELRANKEVALAPVAQNGRLLKYVHEKLWEDRDVVLAAVQNAGQPLVQNPGLLFYGLRDVDEEHRASLEELADAAKWHGCVLELASADLRADREVVIEAVRGHGGALAFASQELRGDPEVVLEAVRRNGESLRFASDALRADKMLVLEAVLQSGWALEHASEELRADRDVLLEAVKQCGQSISKASSRLHADKEVVLAAVNKNGFALQYASQELRADKDVVQTAVDKDPESLEWACPQFREDKEIIFRAVAKSPRSLNHALGSARIDKENILAGLRSWGVYDNDDYRDKYQDVDPRAFEGMWDDDIVDAMYDANIGEEVALAPIAMVGDLAPAVTVSLSIRDLGTGTAEPEKCTFECVVSLLPGTTFTLNIRNNHTFDRRWGERRPQAILNDLAEEIVDNLGFYSEIGRAERVFINFRLNDDGDSLVVTPWDWSRPLRDFLPTSPPTA